MGNNQQPRTISWLKFIGLGFVALAGVSIIIWKIFGVGPALAAAFMILGPLALLLLVAVVFFRKLGAGTIRSGFGVQLIPWDVVWTSTKGQTIPATDIFPMMGMVTERGAPALSIAVQDQLTGLVEQSEYRAVLFVTGSPADGTVEGSIQVAIQFPKTLPGTLLCHRVEQGIKIGQQDVALESVDFNRGVVMAANPRSIPWQVFAPDFMDWYLRIKPAPSIFLDQDHGTLLYMFTKKSLRELKPMFEKIIHTIATSGALEHPAAT